MADAVDNPGEAATPPDGPGGDSRTPENAGTPSGAAGPEAPQTSGPAAGEQADQVPPADAAQPHDPTGQAGDSAAAPEQTLEGAEPHSELATREGDPSQYDYGPYDRSPDHYGDVQDYRGANYDYQDEEWDDEEYEDDEEHEDEDEDEEDEDEDGEPGQRKMTLVEHLEELRMRIIRAGIGLIVGMAVSLFFGQYIFKVMNAPLIAATGKPPVNIDMTAPFMMYMKICLYMGIIVAAPWIFYQLWMFVSAGLYPNERKYVKWAVPFCAGLFVLGAAFFLMFISYPLLKFFNLWNKEVMDVEPMVSLDNHISFMTSMMLVFGLCFQTPIAVLILAKMGLVTMKTLNRYRKHVIVIILIIAALCTSPSPLDQIALAIPMWMLYELGVVLTYFLVEKKRRAEELAAEHADAEYQAERRREQERYDAEYEDEYEDEYDDEFEEEPADQPAAQSADRADPPAPAADASGSPGDEAKPDAPAG